MTEPGSEDTMTDQALCAWCKTYPARLPKYVGCCSDTCHDLMDLTAEVARLRACAEAVPLTDGRTCRVSMDLTADGRPCLIVTAPAHWDEAKLGDVIAGTLNLWEKTAQAVADQKRDEAKLGRQAFQPKRHEDRDRRGEQQSAS